MEGAHGLGQRPCEKVLACMPRLSRHGCSGDGFMCVEDGFGLAVELEAPSEMDDVEASVFGEPHTFL